jgi:GT2 family glycosyltransferase
VISAEVLPAVAPVVNAEGLDAEPNERAVIPRASIIIVNYNGRQHLEGCLRLLLGGTDGEDEVIVVDNASTDGSAELVERRFPHVRVIRNRTNLGYGDGNNVGARRARGQFLVFLNPDTVVEPGWLEPLIKTLESDPRAGLATSRILLLSDPDRINTCGNDVHLTGLTLCRGMGKDREAFAVQGEVAAVSGAAFAMRRELFEALGGFDASFFMYMEDTDLSWRARLAGYGCLFVPQSVVYHDYALHFGPRKTFFQERNRYMMLLKSLRWPTLLLLLPALLLGEIVTWGYVLTREPQRLANKLRAYAWVAGHWGRVMESRRQVQTGRRINDRDLIARCATRLAFEQTGDGFVARLAHLAFDPLFYFLQRLALMIIWW